MGLIGGIDEAGRGPVFGPLVVCGLTIDGERESMLREIGVKDSKQLSPQKREKIALEIRKVVHAIAIRFIQPEQIDSMRASGISLNKIEVRAMGEIVSELKPARVFIDAVDVKEERFARDIKHTSKLPEVEIIAKHKADSIYPIVGAASIIAKTSRDAEIAKLQQTYGELGSGYPSDPVTIAFLENWVTKHKSLPPFARKSWKTAENVLEAKFKQKKITDF